jgi:enoyl-CoA hydratase
MSCHAATDEVDSTLEDGILVIRLNRPQHYNAWTTAMRDVLCGLLDEAAARAEIRALVFTGTGDKAFCAGQDLAETETFLGEAHTKDWLDRLKRLYDAVRAMPKPVVGALNGLAAGSGFQLTLLMDVIVAHPGVTMGQPEVNSGIPSILGPWLMQQSLGRSRTVELAVTGRMMDAVECHRLGLIHHLVAPEQVLATALAIAQDLAAKPPHAMRLTKEFLRRANAAEYERAWQWAAEGQVAAFETGQPQQVMRAFFATRRARKAAKA